MLKAPLVACEPSASAARIPWVCNIFRSGFLENSSCSTASASRPTSETFRTKAATPGSQLGEAKSHAFEQPVDLGQGVLHRTTLCLSGPLSNIARQRMRWLPSDRQSGGSGSASPSSHAECATSLWPKHLKSHKCRSLVKCPGCISCRRVHRGFASFRRALLSACFWSSPCLSWASWPS